MSLDAALLTSSDFIGVRAALVKALDGDGNRALVLTRIYFRADSRWREAHDADGAWWWRATYETIATETGLSVDQARRCVKWLIEHGFVHVAKHRVEGPYDQTQSLRVALLESPDDVAESPDVDPAESPDVPSIQKKKTLKILEGTISEDDLELAFERWWKTFPKKVNKPAGRKAYRVAVTKTTIESLALGAIAFARANVETEPRFIAHPATWLNGERWNDEERPAGSGRDSIRSL